MLFSTQCPTVFRAIATIIELAVDRKDKQNLVARSCCQRSKVARRLREQQLSSDTT
jgi:hypothetical protein